MSTLFDNGSGSLLMNFLFQTICTRVTRATISIKQIHMKRRNCRATSIKIPFDWYSYSMTEVLYSKKRKPIRQECARDNSCWNILEAKLFAISMSDANSKKDLNTDKNNNRSNKPEIQRYSVSKGKYSSRLNPDRPTSGRIFKMFRS